MTLDNIIPVGEGHFFHGSTWSFGKLPGTLLFMVTDIYDWICR